MNRGQILINLFNLKKHPEGGYYTSTYRSRETISASCLPARFKGERLLGSAIYYLLISPDFSAFHRINQDEVWHFYEGSSLTIHLIDQSGRYSAVKMGRDYERGEVPQAVVPALSYFAVSVNERNSYSFVGCSLAPGFEFADFELVPREKMLELFPQHEEIIKKYTR